MKIKKNEIFARFRNGHFNRNPNPNQRNNQFVRVGPYWNMLNLLPFLFIFLSFFAYNGVDVLLNFILNYLWFLLKGATLFNGENKKISCRNENT